jgi:hypothetical protein
LYPNGAEDILDCVIDTGARHTTIPQQFWSQLISKEQIKQFPGKRIRGVGGMIDVHVCQLPLMVSGREKQSA